MSLAHASEPRYRIDASTGEERIIARFRPGQRCYCCRSYLPSSMFAPSRILKRDYECRRCHALRCARERLLGSRVRRPAAEHAGNLNAKEATA